MTFYFKNVISEIKILFQKKSHKYGRILFFILEYIFFKLSVVFESVLLFPNNYSILGNFFLIFMIHWDLEFSTRQLAHAHSLELSVKEGGCNINICNFVCVQVVVDDDRVRIIMMSQFEN